MQTHRIESCGEHSCIFSYFNTYRRAKNITRSVIFQYRAAWVRRLSLQIKLQMHIWEATTCDILTFFFKEWLKGEFHKFYTSGRALWNQSTADGRGRQSRLVTSAHLRGHFGVSAEKDRQKEEWSAHSWEMLWYEQESELSLSETLTHRAEEICSVHVNDTKT